MNKAKAAAPQGAAAKLFLDTPCGIGSLTWRLAQARLTLADPRPIPHLLC